MLKAVLIVVAILLLLVVAYVGWVILQAGQTIGVTPVAQAEVEPQSIRVTVTLPGVDAEHQITEIGFPRSWGQTLGITGPDGFSATPYTLDDTGDPADPESAAWVKETNENELRWVGSATLTPDTPTILEFPIQTPAAGEGSFRFQYERKIGVSGQISFFNVAVAISGN